MSERQRGEPFPDALEHMEAKKIGPYPTWRSWRYQLEKEFGISLNNGKYSGKRAGDCRTAEELFHDYYVLRRLEQKEGKFDQVRETEFLETAEENHPDFKEDFLVEISFIERRTSTPFGRKLSKRS